MHNRCDWPGNDAAMIHYHDTEWGTPVHDDAKLFEFLVLDAFQAGLSWKTILHKRAHFREAFDGFDATAIALYTPDKVEALMQNSGIIRNRLKITGTIRNAQAFLKLKEEFGSFDAFIWQFTQHRTLVNHWQTSKEIPPVSPEAEAMSKSLKKKGFTFAGPTICYAFMQAAGMVNDHLTTCFRHKACCNPTR